MSHVSSVFDSSFFQPPHDIVLPLCSCATPFSRRCFTCYLQTTIDVVQLKNLTSNHVLDFNHPFFKYDNKLCFALDVCSAPFFTFVWIIQFIVGNIHTNVKKTAAANIECEAQYVIKNYYKKNKRKK